MSTNFDPNLKNTEENKEEILENFITELYDNMIDYDPTMDKLLQENFQDFS